MKKLYIGLFIAGLIAAAGWQYTRVVKENGQLAQSNKQLQQSLDDEKAVVRIYSNVANLNAKAVSASEKRKKELALEAANLKNELEILKHENADIKKWSITVMPSLLAQRLLFPASGEEGSGLFETPAPAPRPYPRAEIEIQNENLYGYAGDLRAALKSCNKDKEELRNWYSETEATIARENHPDA